ncbi:MAG: alpha/beta hydrolase [Segniliparus sp.]|uniref:alpha/beta hydrolase n=1 Tax=Segniliparus sp. TaxID=2804064 RepID=UPI003F2BB50A
MSGPLTRALLEKLNPSVLSTAAQALRARAGKIADEQAQFPKRLRFPASGKEWTGAASDALQERASGFGRAYGTEHTRLLAAAETYTQADGYISESAKTARQFLAGVESMPMLVASPDGSKTWDCGEPFEVAQDFAVHVKPGSVPQGAPWQIGQLLQFKAAELTEDLKRLVGQLEDLGRDWGSKVREAMDFKDLALDSKGQPYTPYDSHRAAMETIEGMASGAVPDNPFILRDQWGKLNDGEKEEMWRKHAHIGDLDGIPAVDKDKFNRATFDRETEEKKQGVQRILDEHKDWNLDHAPHNPGSNEGRQWREWKNRADAAQADLQKSLDLQGALKPVLDPNGKEIPGQHRYLLQHAQDGTRAVVSAGNPDTAKNVATFVPGTTEHADHLPGDMHRIDGMFNSAVNAGSPKDGTSVIGWFGYDAPDWVGENNPSSPKGAEAGAPLLDRFQDGLRATHEGDPSHNTVIGHSYGSTVVGEAASHGRTLNADDVIYLGSPGVEMQSPSDLRLTGVDPSQAASHTWAAADKWDPVPHSESIPVVHGPFGVPIPALPGTGLGPFGDSPLGPAPTGSEFNLPKSQIIPVDPHPPTWDHPMPGGAHSDYWDDTQGKDSALTTMGVIINGPKR